MSCAANPWPRQPSWVAKSALSYKHTCPEAQSSGYVVTAYAAAPVARPRLVRTAAAAITFLILIMLCSSLSLGFGEHCFTGIDNGNVFDARNCVVLTTLGS